MPEENRSDSKFAIELQDVHKWYGEFHVLKDINLNVARGERIVVCGPSGSGKSTMIRCINRLEEHQKGDIVAIDGKTVTPGQVMEILNRLGGANGVGRDDIVENRYVGMKSRGCYETPAGTIMLKAHRAMESLTLDREVAHLKDELMPRYASLIYNGYWWSPERRILQEMIDASQEAVNGKVRVRLYKGNVIIAGRMSETDSLFDERIATFEDDAGAYDQKDAEGFIKLNALRLRIAASKKR